MKRPYWRLQVLHEVLQGLLLFLDLHLHVLLALHVGVEYGTVGDRLLPHVLPTDLEATRLEVVKILLFQKYDAVLLMEGRLAEELYADSLHLSKLEVGPTSANDQENKLNDYDGDDLNLDGSLWDGSDEKLDNSSDLDREWQRRHDQFHTIGYRDGLIAGKEASAQEGFNIGFKQSVLTGYSWGAVRGVTSAFAYLPDQLKERLVETLEQRNEFQGLYESVHSLSTTDALRLFNEDIKAKEHSEQSVHVEVSPHTAGLQEQTSHAFHLRNYHGQLESLLRESPGIDIHLPEME